MLCIGTYLSTTRNVQTPEALSDGVIGKWWHKWRLMFRERGTGLSEWPTKSKGSVIKWWRSVVNNNALLPLRRAPVAGVQALGRSARLAICEICSVLSRIKSRC